mmetsp:Transcript_61312/g.150070  ORF Transcript_61312/g.150070 Transcript_61312/m.150070 type:complete len:579 (-) Transcript_61312:25-1761(-)
MSMSSCKNRHRRRPRPRPRRRPISSNNHVLSNIIVSGVCVIFLASSGRDWFSAHTSAFVITAGLRFLPSAPPTVSATATATSQKSTHTDHDGDIDDDGDDNNAKHSSFLHRQQQQQWIEKYLTQYQLELFEEDPPSSYRGVKTLVDRQPDGEIIFEIPNSQVILASDFLEGGVDDISDFFRSENDDEEWTEEQIIALGLMSLHKEKDSNPDIENDNDTSQKDRRIYVNSILPQRQHYAVWTLPQQIWDDIIAPSLPGCYRESFEATRIHVSQFVQQATNIQHQKQDNAKKSYRFSKDEILWSFSMIRSRSVAVPELRIQEEEGEEGAAPPLAIIPGLDLFNHRFNRENDDHIGTQLNWISDDEVWAISTAAPMGSSSKKPVLKKGQEVFLSYGDDKDNWKLLLTYGFALRHNPNQVVFFTWEDVLDSAHRVRPTIFAKRTCQQLLKHPQLQMYVTVSENRATFSFDATTDQPRESLLNGLTILSNLAAQLGRGNDDSLSNDVLNDLIQHRIQDLESGIEILRNHRSQEEDAARSVDGKDSLTEWQPFIDSVRRALEEESIALKALPSLQERSCAAETG